MVGSSSLNVTDKPSSIILSITYIISYNSIKSSVLLISASSDDNPLCVLHVDFHSDNYGNIKLFTENVDKWTKVQQSWNARKKIQKKTKYDDILETLAHSFKCNYG